MQTIHAIKQAARRILLSSAIDEKEQTYRDFCTLLSEITGLSSTELITRQETYLSVNEYQQTLKGLIRLTQNEPLELVLGYAYFLGQKFKVKDTVLIPRVATEELVKQAQICVELSAKKERPLTILDLGTGSGVIAITLALFCQNHKPAIKHRIWALDCSKKALKIAKTNAKAHRVQIEFERSNWFEALQSKESKSTPQFDLIVSNPPYVAKSEINHLQNSTSHEPQKALFANKNGLSDLKKIIKRAKKYLNQGGYLVLEHGFNQQPILLEYLNHKGYEAKGFKDAQGQDRGVVAIWQG